MSWGAEENYIDFVVVCNKGTDYLSHLDKHYLGAVAEQLINKTPVNVLFIAEN